MPRINLTEHDQVDSNQPESIQLLQLQPEMGKLMGAIADVVYNQFTLSKRIREVIRMRVAQINQCQVCLNFRFAELAEEGIDEAFYAQVEDWQNSGLFSEQEKLAIEYTERFCTDHLSLNDEFFSRLNQHFSASEVYEITTIIAGLMANGRILQVLQVEQDSCAI